MKKKLGKLFWITGLSGSGKTTLANKIAKFIRNKFGETLVLSGDDLRAIFNYSKLDRKSRYKYALSYSKFCQKIITQNVNIIFSTVSLFHNVRSWNRRKFKKNYIEIFIDADINKLISKKKKTFYLIKSRNIVGKNIVAEFPKKPDIKITNDFTKTITQLKKELINKIKKKYR